MLVIFELYFKRIKPVNRFYYNRASLNEREKGSDYWASKEMNNILYRVGLNDYKNMLGLMVPQKQENRDPGLYTLVESKPAADCKNTVTVNYVSKAIPPDKSGVKLFT